MFKKRKGKSGGEIPRSAAKPVAKKLVAEYIAIQGRLEEYKILMNRQDQILGILRTTGTSGTGYVVTDLFDQKISAWKSVCFRRYGLGRDNKQFVRGGK